MTRRPTALLLVTATLLAAACAPVGSAPPPSSDVIAATTPPLTAESQLSDDPPITLLIIVDDDDAPSAAALRARVTQSVRGGLLHVLEQRFGSCGDPDPAAWHPVDLRVVVARPSAPDVEALLTPLDLPALAWVTQTSNATQIDAVVAAAATALEQRLAQPGDVYRPLHAAQRALELVTGARGPVTDVEASIAASLPAGALTLLLVASTRDDEDVDSIADLEPSAAALAATDASTVVGPFEPSTDACRVGVLGPTRLEAWSLPLPAARLFASTCGVQATWDGLLEAGTTTCAPACQSWSLPVTPEGVTACTLLLDQADLGGCATANGWRDPGGQATFVQRQGTQLRRCEVVQLTGAALESCRADFACPGCGSGWCATEVASLLPAASCPAGAQAWPLRLVGGAAIAADGWLTVTCDAAASP